MADEDWPEVLSAREMMERWPGATPKMVLVLTPAGTYKRETDGNYYRLGSSTD